MLKQFRPIKLTTFCLMILAQLNAQNESFDLRIKQKNVDCSTGKLSVNVEVKASNAASVFNMGDANYRFEYDASHIKSPTIISQDNFSNTKNRNYGKQNLNGSREVGEKGIVSLNTFYSSNDGGVEKVNDKWTSIATLDFKIVDFKTPSVLKLHDDKTFPISGMSHVEITNSDPSEFEYNLKIVPKSKFIGNLEFDPRKSCPNSIPFVDNTRIRIKRGNEAYVKLSILDNDVADIHKVEIKGTKHGKASLKESQNIVNQSIEIHYQPNADFMGQEDLTLVVADKFGNLSEAKLQIIVSDSGLMVYNGFSPNNDGVNDILKVEGLDNQKHHVLNVYDLKGRELFRSDNYKNDWNGTVNGQPLLNGTYLYILETDTETLRSYIEIKR